MSDRKIIPHCAWAMQETDRRKLPPDLSWLVTRIAERVGRNTLQWWSSLAAMMADTRFSRRKVQYLLRQLPPDLIETRKGANGRWVLTLVRPAVETPDCEAAELARGAYCAPPDPERGARCAPYPLKKDSPEGKEEREPQPQAAAPSPSSVPQAERSDEGKDVRCIEAMPPLPPEPRKAPLPDDWRPSPEERQLALDNGLNPDELTEELADWARAKDVRSADWGANFRRFIRCGRNYRIRHASKKPGRNWRQENADFVADTFAELTDGWLPEEGATIVGFAP